VLGTQFMLVLKPFCFKLNLHKSKMRPNVFMNKNSYFKKMKIVTYLGIT
jgi:hypothetical protein